MSGSSAVAVRPLPPSRVELTCAAVAAAGAIALTLVAFMTPHARARPLAFAVGAALSWGVVVGTLFRHRHQNDSGGASAGAAFGAATAVTLLRGLGVSFVAGHLLAPAPTTGAAVTVALVYTAAALLDNVDGRIARRRHHTTTLGARLDVAVDALGLLVAPIVAIVAGRLPPWYLLLACAYPAMRIGLWLRRQLGRPVFVERLRPDPRARFFAGVQMGVVATALYPVLPAWLLWPAATIAMIPTLVLFAREWAVATGAD